MDEKLRSSAFQRLPVMIPMLIFVLVFSLYCAAMLGLLMKGIEFTTQADELNAGIQLCRNAAEQFRSGETLSPGKNYYDDTYHPSTPENASFYLTVEQAERSQPRGTLLEASIRAYSKTDELLYTLTVTRYVSDRSLP